MTELAMTNEKYFFDDGSYKGEIPNSVPDGEGGYRFTGKSVGEKSLTAARIQDHIESDQAERGEA